MEHHQPGHTGLRRRVLSALEVFAQSIANIAPSAVIAFVPAAIFASAGKGTWLSWVLGTVVVFVVAYCLAQFARRHASAGSLYGYAAQGFGPIGAYVTGMALLIGCYGIAAGSLEGAAIYASSFLSSIGLPAGGTAAIVILDIVLAGLATLFTVRGVRLSARVALVLEVISITIITMLIITTLVHHGSHLIDRSQFSLSGASADGIVFGVVLAILGFVGFESAAALGVEAKKPFRAIPRAIYLSALVAGILYILAAYTQVLGFEALKTPLNASAAPLVDLANAAGLGWLHYLIDIGITSSFFAVVVAPLNVIGRVLYVMGREGIIWSKLGQTHPVHDTPYVGLLSVAPFIAGIPVILTVTGTAPINVLVYLDVIGTFGYMLAYAIVALAAPIFLRRLAVPTRTVWAAAVFSAAAMAYVFYKNVVPVPPYPLNTLPYAFVGMMVAALIWYVVVRIRTPENLRKLGTIETEEAAGIR